MLLIVLLLLFLIPINKKKSASPSFLYHVDYAPSNSVVIKNILPVADSLGKTFDGSGTKEGVQGYTEITISNTDKVNHEYYILIDKQDSDLLEGLNSEVKSSKKTTRKRKLDKN